MTPIKTFLAAKRDTTLLRWAAALFVAWLACTGPLRWTLGSELPSWLVGSAPNFFAGLTLTFWQAYVVPSRPVGSVAVAFLVLCIVEVVQLAMPQHRGDWWDVGASLAGCCLAAAVLYWRRSRPNVVS